MLALASAIAVHHSGMATGAAHGDHGMSAAMEMCLAVMTAIGTAVAAVALGVLARARWLPVRIRMPAGVGFLARPPLPRARAGPPLLCLLCVSRR